MAALGLAGLIVGLLACGGAAPRPDCVAYETLRSAVRTIDSAKGPVAAHDQAAAGRIMDEVDRLLAAARRRLSGEQSDAGTGSAVRAMLEAANYLDYMTGQFRSTGSVDFSIAQFASRELTRAASGAGGRPLNC